MYRKVLAALDNSEPSLAALRMAAVLARVSGGTVVGFHALAARLHEDRFHQMEPGLPERYQQETELHRQRSLHDTLISRGLSLISDSYLDQAEEVCRGMDVPFQRKLAEGRNYAAVLQELEQDSYDLVALGATGLGATEGAALGSVCERVLRYAHTDVLIARGCEDGKGMLAATDGSPTSFRAVERAVAVGEVLGEPVEVVSVFDPHFHTVAFKSIAGVLSEEAGQVFRFREQERLHDEIIDKGLEKLYQGHLARASTLATAQPLATTLLTGKPYEALVRHAQERRPRLLVAGRFGQHRTEVNHIGSTPENLACLAPCPLLVVTGETTPPPAPEVGTLPALTWTAEAEARLERVPPFVRAMARRAIEDYARRRGFHQVTAEVMSQARDKMGM